MSNAGEYLTMARIMKHEWLVWCKENMWGKGYTGHTEIALKQAYEAGFMKGFEGKYFGEMND
jgi:hypothetical protein